jgi:CheY-like chemotaxis protein/anti-sigma regulatory factor (Ser/Thr protein kinase)
VNRIATGKIVLKAEPIDYRRVVEASLEAARPAIDARRHRLVVEIADAPLPLLGDTTRLVQALQNLLENAARYTPAGGEIRLVAAPRDGALVVTVADTGIGIRAEAQQRIFELFTQEHAASGAEAGLGIGLALARSLVERHGGRLTVESAGVGRGSTFAMTLPMHAVVADADAPPTQAAPAPAVAQAALAAVPAALRVLVVDDNRDSADTMVELLEMMGQTVRGAYGADEALRVAAEFRPQVVLLDLNMPDGDGFSVLRRLRAATEQPLYVGAMTGYGQPRDRARTRAEGFQIHLTKPVLPEHLGPMLAEATRFVAAAEPAR